MMIKQVLTLHANTHIILTTRTVKAGILSTDCGSGIGVVKLWAKKCIRRSASLCCGKYSVLKAVSSWETKKVGGFRVFLPSVSITCAELLSKISDRE
jgi:hypothetical protein